ncbi:MAG: archaeosortase/exosortase family protein [Nanoarchaeota archaeon]|nr:archaeosortase/exosortase family protein [Nanoarchaeota archaeon]MBU4452281.1 archaeosortase/exosortase family protein [Nanoarchaeota archaeon]MCG2724041.1 archaeosortase/exosortase family protein [archaeon]
MEFLKKHRARILKKIKTPFQKKLLNIFIFLTAFTALSLPLHFLLWVNFDATPMQVIVASSVKKLLEASGIAVSQSGLFLSMITKTGPLTVQIIKDCVGWKSVLALFGLIFATPKIEMNKRIYGLIAGTPIILAGNILRIYATIYVTVYGGLEYWEITHTYLWQEGLIVLVIATWYIWLRICKNNRSKLSFI